MHLAHKKLLRKYAKMTNKTSEPTANREKQLIPLVGFFRNLEAVAVKFSILREDMLKLTHLLNHQAMQTIHSV